MNSLFQQKQRELVLAVSKVEELTRQLEMLKNGRVDGYHDNQSAVAELDRLYKELQVTGILPRRPARRAKWGVPLTVSGKKTLVNKNYIIPNNLHKLTYLLGYFFCI